MVQKKGLPSKKLMSLFIGKSNKSCNAVSDESSMSSELDESDPGTTPNDLELLHSKSSLKLLPGVEDPTWFEANSVVMADTEPHLLEDDP